MKQTNLLKSFFLLCALIVGSSSVWATEVTYSITAKNTLSTSGTAPTGSSATLVETYDTSKQMTSGNSQTFTLSKYSGYQITGLTLSMHSNSSKGAGTLSYSTDGGETWTYLVGSDGSGVTFSNSAWYGSWSTSYVDVTKSPLNIICGTSNIVIKIEATANSLYCQSYTITYETYDANKVVTPTISISTTTPFVSSKAVTIESETEGASIYYTTDGSTTPTTSSTLYDPSNKPVINATTTIKAIAVKEGMTDSDVATQTITKETVLNGISALNSATTSTTATPHYVKLTDAQITYVESSGDYGFLNDANAGIYLYVSDLVLNTKYNGIYRITSKTHHSWKEVTAFEEIDGEGSSEVAEPVDPIEMTASDLETNFSSNVNRQIRIKNHTTTAKNKLTENISLNTTYYGKDIAAGTYTFVGYPDVYDSSNRFRVVAVYPKPAAPTFSPAEGIFYDNFTLTLSCATDDVTIYYTTNGDDPTTTSLQYDAENKPTISAGANVTVKALAVKAGMESDIATATYTYYTVKQPAFETTSGTAVYYNDNVEVTCETDGADIYYTLTTDGSDPADPTDESTEYPDGGITIAANSVKIKVIAKKGSDYSPVASATYTLKNPDAPVFSVEEGAVARNTVVNISSREGTTIYYTVDGSDPDGADDSGVNSINITVTDDMTIRAICIDGAANISSETSGDYTIAQVAKPAFSAAAGMVSKGTQLTVTTATEGATIYYTLDGSTPTSSSNVYSGYIQINGTHTVKAIAIKENYIDSEVMSAAYTVAGDNEEFEFKNLGYSNAEDVTTVKGTNVTLTFAKNDGEYDPKYYTTGNGVRMYAKNMLTVSGTKNIAFVEFTFSGESYNNLSLVSGEPGELNVTSTTVKTWNGSAISIKFTASATNRIQKIKVFYELSDDNATVGDSRLAGFCSEHKVDFSTTGLKAYKAKVDEGNVVLTEITDGIVPANTGVILNGDADDYVIPFTDASATTDFADNQMVGVTQRTQVLWNPSEGVYNYILQSGNFKKASDGYLKPNRAYLSTSYNVGGAGAKPLTIIFAEEETDGIRSVGNTTEDVVRYNLSGQKVGSDYKGIVIVNGKKYLRK